MFLSAFSAGICSEAVFTARQSNVNFGDSRGATGGWASFGGLPEPGCKKRESYKHL